MGMLEVDRLTIAYADSREPAVHDLCFSIERGAALGVVGESGSGKTQTALAVMGLLPRNATVTGSIRFDGQELVGAGDDILNRYRARRIGMVFQDPRQALNPYLQIGRQLSRILLEHGLCGPADARRRTIDMLQKVGLPDAERQYAAYPHELSGGMRQRAMIAAALIAEPDLLIADEPTTALDVTVQAQILKLIRDSRTASGVALLLITHDLGVIAGNCEHMLVVDRGCCIEDGGTRDVFACADDPRTRALLAAAPRPTSVVIAGAAPAEARPVLGLDGLSVSFRERGPGRGARLNAVRQVSMQLHEGETVAVVGESGSGKTTLIRAALGLVRADSGRVTFRDAVLPAQLKGRSSATRRQIQMVFQDPLASLDPAMKVREIIAEPLRIHAGGMGRLERRQEAEAMLSRVGLDATLADRYPHELSGGQAQRVAIARSLILKPSVLICDEAVAALDGTVRRGILDLLCAEQQRSGLAIIFISHDLAVVRQISHRVLVMYMGRMCEISANEALFRRPRHPYTRVLLDSVPVPDPGVKPREVPLETEIPSLQRPPSGCPFHPRCQHAVAICTEQVPVPANLDGSQVACHRAGELDLSY